MENRRFLLGFAVALPAAIAAGHFLIGGAAVLAIAIAAILIIVARFDNHSGSCLLATIMLIVAIGSLLALLMVVAKIAIH